MKRSVSARHPLVGVAVCFLIGSGVGLTFQRGPVGWLLIGAAVLLSVACGLLLRGKAGHSTPLLLGTVLLLAWGSVWLRSDAPGLKECLPDAPAGPVTLTASVQSDPVEREMNGGTPAVVFLAKATSLVVGEDKTARPVSETLIVKLHGRVNWPPLYGEIWQFRGTLTDVYYRDPLWSGPRRHYELATGLRSATRVSKSDFVASFVSRLTQLREAASAILKKGIEDGDPDAVGLMQALVLGYRSHLSRELRDRFARTGTLHIFAISGLHVGIVASMCIFVLGIVCVPFPYWVLVMAPVLGGYTVVTGGRASAIRASVMATIYFAAPLLGRKPDVVSALAVAALAILSCWPEQLFNVGFIYSFTVVAGIIIYYPLLDRALKRVGAADPFRIEKDAWWIRALRVCVRYLKGILCVSIAAWLASAPLSAHFFARFTPVALIGNLIVIPLAFLILVSGALALVGGSCAVVVAEIFNNASYILVKTLIALISRISTLPGACIDIEPLRLHWVLLWYAALLLLAHHLYRSRDDGVLSQPSFLDHSSSLSE